MLSVGVICAYFGKLPGSYSCWMKSCEWNPSIDFLLFTDQETISCPKNVKIIRLDFAEIQEMVESKLGRPVALEYPYKLCDLKPLYGVIFEDYLKKYDYWGHCDMDMVFGDIRGFLERYEFEKYEKFLDLGHLSLYKNTPDNNHRFQLNGSQCGSWEDVISDTEGHAFDERSGIYQIYKNHNIPIFDKRIYADISMIYSRFRCALKDPNYDLQVFYWEKGHVYRSYWDNGNQGREEYIYIHFKKRNFETAEFDVQSAQGFYIGPAGYTEKTSNVSLEDVDRINPYPGEKVEREELVRMKRMEKRDRWKKWLNRLFRSSNLIRKTALPTTQK